MAGTCNFGEIDKLVKWVVEDDPEAREEFGNAVKNGMNAFEALLVRLDHDKNAQALVASCSVEARQALANRGFHS